MFSFTQVNLLRLRRTEKRCQKTLIYFQKEADDNPFEMFKIIQPLVVVNLRVRGNSLLLQDF